MKENGCGFVGEIAALRLQGDTLHSLTLGRYNRGEIAALRLQGDTLHSLTLGRYNRGEIAASLRSSQ